VAVADRRKRLQNRHLLAGRRAGIAGRAMPLSCFQGLSRLDGVRLISLQKGFGTEQLGALRAWNLGRRL